MPGWDTAPGNGLFQQIKNPQAPPGPPVLAFTQEHGAIPPNLIDYLVSVTRQSVKTDEEAKPGEFIFRLRSRQGGIEYPNDHVSCSLLDLMACTNLNVQAIVSKLRTSAVCN